MVLILLEAKAYWISGMFANKDFGLIRGSMGGTDDHNVTTEVYLTKNTKLGIGNKDRLKKAHRGRKNLIEGSEMPKMFKSHH